MKKLVTVATFNFPAELLVIKSRFEAEGIHCHTVDENLVQANNMYSVAIGGVKLQVRLEDERRALKILAEMGYLEHQAGVVPPYVRRWDAYTDKIPYLGALSSDLRIMIILAVLVVLFVPILFVMNGWL
ncbi:hypothetical protein FUAX_25770 [Fulvitalea axinellae]|uniref:DUF2007 domain-containing protein n=1 Tax=Fulvitalea axinellae TaxID=1182444 RepID=A0AAU9CLG7_9BACT|nr:hypothetical protein FUAX_25770 [Fulvitalea axinellae]